MTLKLARPLTSLATLRQPCHRKFFSLPSQPSLDLSLSATRTLPYSARDLYAIIAAIEQYPSFLPFCSSATVTQWTTPSNTTSSSSNPDSLSSSTTNTKSGSSQSSASSSPTPRLPVRATLGIGFRGITETFESLVYCDPHRAVEALVGTSTSEVLSEANQDIVDAYAATKTTQQKENQLFEFLRTKWTLREFPFKPSKTDTPGKEGDQSVLEIQGTDAKPRTDVHLVIEGKWKSALYAAMSGAVVGKVADVMVEAFEKRAREVIR